MPKSPRHDPSALPDRDPEPEGAGHLPRREFLGVAAGAVLGLTTGCTDDGDGMDDGSEGSTTEDLSETTADSSGGPLPDVPEDPGVPFDPLAIPESTELFPRTPMAGEMQVDSVLIAGYVSTAETITLRMWQPTEVEGQVVLVDEQEVVPDPRGFFKVAVEGLEGGQWYDYGLFSGDAETGFGARSLLCRVRTALPEGSLEPVRIAIAACIGRGIILPEYVDPDDLQPFEPWDTMLQAAELDYDVFIHLGDQAYLDEVYDAGGTEEQYLAAWGTHHGGGYRVVYPKTGMYFTWDDHEVTNNGTVDPWTTDPVELTRIENAQRAYFTVMPIDATEPGLDPLWRSFRWGDTVEFIVLDCRSERQAPESGVYLSDEQFSFLLERLRDSPCRFKCVVNSVPFSQLSIPGGDPLLDALLNPLDRWEGYVTQRAELMAFVDEHAIRNVLWITGDVHMCYVGQVDPDATTDGESMWEVCVTSGNVNPLASELSDTQFPWKSQNPHVPLITFDPGADLVRVDFVDTNGAVAYTHELTLG